MNDLSAPNKRVYIILTLILLLGLMVRLPGIFWGFHAFPNERFVNFHPDERCQILISQEFAAKSINQNADHVKGFGFQLFLVSILLKPFVPMDIPTLILTGRLLALTYGLLNILLLYFLSNEIFKNKYIALFSSLFLALSGLHVTQSHYATVETGTTFWMYLTLYCSLLYKGHYKNIYLFLAVLSAGFALAFKLSVPILIPFFYILYNEKVKPCQIFLCLLGVIIFFIAANGGYYTLINLKLTLMNCTYNDIFYVYQHHHKWVNLFLYLVGVPPSLGLVSFIFLLIGAFFVKEEAPSRVLNKDIFFIIFLPWIMYSILICSLDVMAFRFFLPLVPLLAMLGGYGLYKLKKRLIGSYFLFLLVIVILYQLAYVMGTEYYYIFDTRQASREWIIKEIPEGETIHLGRYVVIPDLKQYKIRKDYNSDYLVIHESGYLRYLPLFKQSSKFPLTLKDVYHANYNDLHEIQRIFKGKSSFVLVKSFPVIYVTPENILYKKLFGNYSDFVGDVLIFKRKQE